MSNTSNTQPSLAGVRCTGLELGKRPQVQSKTQPQTEPQERITTQRPSAPTTSNRGYA